MKEKGLQIQSIHKTCKPSQTNNSNQEDSGDHSDDDDDSEGSASSKSLSMTMIILNVAALLASIWKYN